VEPKAYQVLIGVIGVTLEELPPEKAVCRVIVARKPSCLTSQAHGLGWKQHLHAGRVLSVPSDQADKIFVKSKKNVRPRGLGAPDVESVRQFVHRRGVVPLIRSSGSLQLLQALVSNIREEVGLEFLGTGSAPSRKHAAVVEWALD